MPPNDYLTLMLINMSAGLFVLAGFFYCGLTTPGGRFWAPGLAMSGLIALLGGLHITFTWPFAGKAAFANVAFGEMSILLGIAFLGAALAQGLKWTLHSVAMYAFVAGLCAILVGIRIMILGLTAAPQMTGFGFILTGLIGVLSLPTVGNPIRVLRSFTALVTLLAAALWAFVGLSAYWAHLEKAFK